MSLGGDRSVRLTTGADLDLNEAFTFYEGVSVDLAFQFLNAARAKMSSLSSFSSFPLRREGIRRVKIDGFPYGIFFKVDEVAKEIVVEAIRHQSLRSQPGQ